MAELEDAARELGRAVERFALALAAQAQPVPHTEPAAAPTKPRHPDQLLTPEQAAEELGVAVRTLYSWRSAGEGPESLKVGKYLRYRWSAITAFLAGREAQEARRV